jgi:rfaE bifunctional protein kinase chain/domain
VSLKPEMLQEILNQLPSRKVALIGDGCVDIYWEADMRLSELSREVPHYPLPVVEERFSLGAGANVLANLAALGVGEIRYVGCIGKDWRGEIFRKLLKEQRISDRFLLASDYRVTPAYCKPIRKGISPVCYEDPRLDFNNRTPLTAEEETGLLEKLEEAASGADILVVCDQLANGCITKRVQDRIMELGKRMPVIVDSRDRVNEYRNVIIKPNEVETCQALQLEAAAADSIEEMCRAAKQMEERNGSPVLITLGGRGVIWCSGGECVQVPAYSVEPPIDFVGAGDSFLAGFSAVYGLDFSAETLLAFANLVPAVTIRKIGTTGTAAPEELQSACQLYSGKLK